MLRRPRRLVRLPAIKLFQIIEKGRLERSSKFAQRSFCLAHPLDDLVIDVRDIHHVLDGVAFEFEVAPDQIAKNERSPIADVSEIINGRPAAVHPHFSAGRIKRNELLDRAGQRVE